MGRSEASRANSRRASNEAKRRRTGVCVDCGATTRYAGGTRGFAVSPRCQSCANKRAGLRLRGTGPRGQQLLGLLATGPQSFTQICLALGITANNASQLLNRMRRYGLIVRPSRGVYRLP
jgi:hypothetical protein